MLLALASAALGAGCHAYVPAQRQALGPGTTVRVHLSSPQERLLEGWMDDERVLTGDVARVGRDSLSIMVWRADRTGGARFDPGRQEITLRWNAIAQLEEQRLSKWRTTGLIGGLAVGTGLVIGALIRAFQDSGGSGPPPNGGGGVTFQHDAPQVAVRRL